MQGFAALGMIVAAPRRLSINGDEAGRSGQVSSTQAVKAAWNKAGPVRLIMMLSQRPQGTPW